MHLIKKLVEFCIRQKLGQAVSNHLVNGHIGKVNSSNSYFVSDVMVLDIDVLCLRIEDRILSKSNGDLIVFSQKDCIDDKF